MPHHSPSQSEFLRQAQHQGHGTVALYARLSADHETPLSAYNKLHDGSNAFLLESAESTAAGGRYSIVGSRPQAILRAHGQTLSLTKDGQTKEWQAEGDILHAIDQLLKPYQNPAPEPTPNSFQDQMPPFTGGVVGYLGFPSVSQFEPSIEPNNSDDHHNIPDSLWMLAAELVIFDHAKRHLYVITNALIEDPNDTERLTQSYQNALKRLNQLSARLDAALPFRHFDTLAPAADLSPTSNTSQQEYEDIVRQCKQYISSGDIFQIVPSQRFSVPYHGSPTDLHRSLRQVNPSPYMFCIEFDQHDPENAFALVGSSPEVHVRLHQQRIDIRPIAGTRPRGDTPEQDQAYAEELLADPKENAEHIMLVDLARNDVGRIAKPGSVTVDDLRIIEKYSHVMHIVSNVHGTIEADKSATDVLRATFPAGTVSGSPKVRALQLLNQLEKGQRGAYSGAVGWIGFDGELDSCIALRTVLIKDGQAHVQAGAGVVADSNPTSEYQETLNKAQGMIKAIAKAQTMATANQTQRAAWYTK